MMVKQLKGISRTALLLPCTSTHSSTLRGRGGSSSGSDRADSSIHRVRQLDLEREREVLLLSESIILLDVEEEKEGERMEEKRKRGEKVGKVKVKVGGKWNRYKLGVVVYSSEGEEEEKDVLGHGKAKEQQAVTWKEEKRKQEEAES